MIGEFCKGADHPYRDPQNDIQKMVTAAQTYNPDDNIVSREASKMSSLVERQIARNRDLIKTPSPEREPDPNAPRPVYSSKMRAVSGTPFDSITPGSPDRSVSPGLMLEGRAKERLERQETTIFRPLMAALQPKSVVPEDMLRFPANSDIARCVGYHLTGGRRHRNKKETRAKEKWDGQWREWFTEGDRNLREADNVLDVLQEGFLTETSGSYVGLPKTVDWQDEAMNAAEVWQPTPVLQGLQPDEVAPSIPMRTTNHLDFGRYQNLPSAYGCPDFKAYDQAKLVRDIGSSLRTAYDKDATELVKRTERENPVKYLKEMTMGDDISGEAYMRSLSRFIGGARVEPRSTQESPLPDNVAGPSNVGCDAQTDVKMELMDVDEADETKPHTQSEKTFDLSTFGLGMSLAEYVATKWRDGWLTADTRRTIEQTERAYAAIQRGAEDLSVQDTPKDSQTDMQLDGNDTLDLEGLESSLYQSAVRESLQRIPLRQQVAEFASRGAGLELPVLLKTDQDFANSGRGTAPPPIGPTRIPWFDEALRKTGEQIVQMAKKQAIDKTGKEGEEVEESEELLKIRYDLVSRNERCIVFGHD